MAFPTWCNAYTRPSDEEDPLSVTLRGDETIEPQGEAPPEQVHQPDEVEAPHDDPVDNRVPLSQDEVSDDHLPQLPQCDHCRSTTVEFPAIRCPANHFICRECLSQHAEVQLSKGDPELLCLHPAECSLAFELEELRKLPQQTFLDLFGRFPQLVEGPIAEPQPLETVSESDDEDIESAEDALTNDASDDDKDDGTMYAAFELAEAVSTRRISLRRPRKTHVKLEEAEDAISDETSPGFDTGKFSVPFLLRVY